MPAMHEFQKANNIGFLQQEGNDAAVYLAQKNRELADLKQEYNLLQMLDLDKTWTAAGARLIPGPVRIGCRPSVKNDTESFMNPGPSPITRRAKQPARPASGAEGPARAHLRPVHQ